MKQRNILIGALAATASWIVAYAATLAVGGGMSAVVAYALIMGWWFTAYVSSILQLTVSTIIPLFVGYLIVFFVAKVDGQSWFYGDVGALTVLEAASVGLAQALIFCSPILFDRLCRWVVQK